MTEKIREYNVVRQIRCTSSMQIRPDLDLICYASADCLHQHLQVI